VKCAPVGLALPSLPVKFAFEGVQFRSDRTVTGIAAKRFLTGFVPSGAGHCNEYLKMAYNKSKHLDAAQKYLQQGKLPQAIAEYQQILKNEPRDQVTLMTLGDLYVRQGETFQALEYFERLAKIFLNDGFTTKAIAIYKKVAKLAPEESRPLERLAELYIQQGVLSEARPIYLQMAEAHLKAGRQPQAAALFRKLLEAEPENMRIQIRLAELLLTMGQQKEAIETLHAAMQRILDRGDHAEAIRLGDRILQIDPTHQPTFLLKVRALSGEGRGEDAAKLLETLPDQDAGNETTAMLLEQYAEGGQAEKAATLAEQVFARDPKHYAITYRVAAALLESGDVDRAETLLALIRDTMIDSGDHELLAQSISRLAELRPCDINPIEWLVDLYGRASDSFRLPDALAQLAHAHESAGNDKQALLAYEQLLERTPEDETTRRAYMRLRARTGLQPTTGEIPWAVKLTPEEANPAPAPPPSTEPVLDEETQRYVTQALTDVDLFSSYGLTQKAIDLLESVLERAPRHMTVLERLLDLSVGAGNDRRTAELASMLEQIATERQDRAAVERYAEFRRRFQRAAGISSGEATAQAAPPAAAEAQEFAVPTIEAELDEPAAQAPSAEAASLMGIPMPTESVVHEVDLSEEWAALSQQLEDAMEIAPAASVGAGIPEATQEEMVADASAFDLELQPVSPAGAATASETLTADSLFADLATEFESASSSMGIPAGVAQPEPVRATQASSSRIAAPANGGPLTSSPAAAGSGGLLGDLFEEFRSELGEVNKADEDLETHYNLGIAYREMGLLEEAISEFQKVASSADKGPAFRYAMQCCTLLGLAFMEKGQPSIAAIWYERALNTPGLDQESILALRFDLGIAQELAGETAAAFQTFSQVYAMNIDYRDVSERIALLGKTR
jgi:pilus assembly protein FimV